MKIGVRVVGGKLKGSIQAKGHQLNANICVSRISYLSGSEFSVRRWLTSPSGWMELLLDEVKTELLSRDSFDRLSCRSNSVAVPGTGGSSPCFWFFFFRLRREFKSLEIPLDPALAVSGSPPCVFGLSTVESIDERPLLRPELSIASDSVDTVQARCDLPP